MTTLETHNITFEGVEYEIQGDWETSDETVGYKGGFSWIKILINDMDVSEHLKNSVIESLTDIIVEKHY